MTRQRQTNSNKNQNNDSGSAENHENSVQCANEVLKNSDAETAATSRKFSVHPAVTRRV